jgi:hypothetical protein
MDLVAGAAMKDDGELRGRCAHYIPHRSVILSNVDVAAPCSHTMKVLWTCQLPTENLS